jgi:hypothetical protein
MLQAFDGIERAPREERGDRRKEVSRAVAVPSGIENPVIAPSSSRGVSRRTVPNGVENPVIAPSSSRGF